MAETFVESPGFLGLLRECLDLSRYRIEQSSTWIHVRTQVDDDIRQGWKLHVTAFESHAAEVLKRSLAVLASSGAHFKIASDLGVLRSLNSGASGESQRGKFVTVYPASDAEAVKLARDLHIATLGLAGPPVPSDRRLTSDSCVYYRYGAFRTGVIQTLLGELIPYILDPDLRLVPDKRGTEYSAPAWVTDPLGGLDGSQELCLLESRYLALVPIYRSSRGVVWAGADLQENTPVVVKRFAYCGSGKKPLAGENALLDRLQAPFFPEVVAYFFSAADQMETLVLRDLGGTTLGQWVERHSPVSDSRIRHIALQIVDALAIVHRANIVHRDLKASNILVGESNRIFVVDFEISGPVGSEGRALGRGTEGYASPQQWNFAPASTCDDIYALGAVLYLMVTGIEPSQAPNAFALLDRDPAVVRPDSDGATRDLVRRCLSFDPEARPTIEQVRDSLTSTSVRESTDGRGSVASRYLELACHLGDALASSAKNLNNENAPSIWWHGRASEGLPCRDLNNGDAGALLALAEIAAVSQWPAHLDVVRVAAHRLLRTPRPAGQLHPGLYVGEGGCALAILRAGQVLQDANLVKEAARIAETVAQEPHASPDLFNGTAGRVLFHLLMYEATRAEDQLQAALAGGDRLLQTMTRTDDGHCSWMMPDGFGTMSGQALLGYAHGAAGIADVLCELWSISHDHRLEPAIRGAYAWISAHATTGLSLGAGIDWKTEPQGPFRGPYWCHGAAGVGRFLLSFAASGLCESPGEVWQLILGAAASVVTFRSCGAVLCHGLAGNIEFMLDVFEDSLDASHLSQAQELADIMLAFAKVTKDGTTFVGDKNEIVPNYMTGYAGVGLTLLRLARPNHGSYGVRKRRPGRFPYFGERACAETRIAVPMEPPVRGGIG